MIAHIFFVFCWVFSIFLDTPSPWLTEKWMVIFRVACWKYAGLLGRLLDLVGDDSCILAMAFGMAISGRILFALWMYIVSKESNTYSTINSRS
jgi:hypothetical protein